MTDIKETLSKKRSYEAELRFLQERLKDQRNKVTVKQQERMEFLEYQLLCISSWMTLLSEDEAFVIQRHLIDSIDIPRIAVEYRERWGEEFGKTERTIKTYQRRALQRIEEFEKQKDELLQD